MVLSAPDIVNFTRVEAPFANNHTTDTRQTGVAQQLCQFIADGLAFLSVDHFLQYMKVLFFATADNGGFTAAAAILKLKTAGEIVARGRRTIAGFVAIEWDKVKFYFLAIGLYAKVSQNTKWKHQLLGTGIKPIAVALGNHPDTDYSTGLTLSELQDNTIAQWTGKNMLGVGLMAVRKYFGMKVDAIKEGDVPADQLEALVYAIHYYLRPHNYIGLAAARKTTYYASSFVRNIAEKFPFDSYSQAVYT